MGGEEGERGGRGGRGLCTFLIGVHRDCLPPRIRGPTRAPSH